MDKKNKNIIITCAFIGVMLIVIIGCVVIIKGLEKSDKKVEISSASKTIIIDKEISDDVKDVTFVSPSLDISDEDEVIDPVIEVDEDRLKILEEPFGDGYEFPKMPKWDFVFIGDSIFDMYNSPVSFPRQLEVYTDSHVYNLSKNMTCAGNSSNLKVSLNQLTDCFLEKTIIGKGEVGSFNNDIERWAKDKHKGQKTAIILNHCINDYSFSSPLANPQNAYDIDSYEGSLRSNISKIKAAYPDAYIVFMKPYILGFNNLGNDPNAHGLNMGDYIASAEKVASEFDLKIFDLQSYAFFAEYRDGYLLEDGIHPNDMCAKTMARLFVDYVENNLK